MNSHTRPDPDALQALRVIIPTRNEQFALPRVLDDLQAQTGVRLRISVVDGESTDQTVRLAQSRGHEVIVAPPGRGRQLNCGWRSCTEDVLLFLHADSHLASPNLLSEALAAWLPHASDTAGHFRLEFVDTPQPKPFFYRHLEAKTALNKPQSFNGDQGLLIHRTLLQRIGGFDESLPFLEDQTLGTAVRDLGGSFMTLPGVLQTSARRFETEGRLARYFAMLLIMCAREAGCTDFLRDAPGLYREQSATGPLRIAPLLQRLLHEAEQRPQTWPIVTRYLRENAWQLPALADSATHGRWRLRARFEENLEPWVRSFDTLDPAIARLLRWSFGRVAPVLLRRR